MQKLQTTEKKLRTWLASKYAPAMAVFSTSDVMDYMREHANLSPAEFLRPFCEVGSLNNRSQQTNEKHYAFKMAHFRLNVVDAQKIDPRYYKDSEYSGLF